ncbi:glycosyltransferase 61 family protein [Cronbergia sp. UHCC 0137]|uniref:glycosyltransferase 61 family protein n=1 Tax=Cronbergia sp. UHCC 0137 TaxID=3110239 RepID=UPI002B20FDB0|nr:glycosyltransferase 61 family protein [Cronbergia sp. UHCC 0137]MEA5619101.1 glycosyltransferase 61 family protein [Cronbergia sp. UHCC 0137]
MDIDQFTFQADSYLEQGNFTEAIRFYEQCIIQFPDVVSVYWYLGLSWLLQGENEQAHTIWLSVFTEGNLDFEPEYLVEFLKNQAKKYLSLRKPEFAQLIYEAILEWDDSQPEIYYNLADSVAIQGNLELAIAHWQTAIELEPNWVDAYLHQAHIWHKLGEFTSAIDCYQHILEIQPNYLVYYEIGLCYTQIKQWELAINCFHNSLQIQGNHAPSYSDLALSLIQLGYLDQGIEYLRKSLEIEPEFAQVLINLLETANLSLTNINENGIKFIQLLLDHHANKQDLYLALNNFLTHLQKAPELSEITPNQTYLHPPTKFYESTQQWIKDNPSIQTNYQQIHPEIDINLTHPQTLDNSLHFSFRFGKKVTLPPSFVVTIPQGRFWLNSPQTQSVIMTDENTFLADLSPDFPILSPNHPDKHPSKHSIFSVDKLPPIQFFTGRVAVLAGLANHIYFHWMLDVLPRFELLKIANIDLIDYFIVDNHLPFQKETLKLLQIPEHKQINIRDLHHVQATELIVPSFAGCVSWMPKWTCDFLKSHFLKSAHLKKRIYITRKLAKGRRILNEVELQQLLQTKGFETVALESMSVIEQAALFSQAEIIISPHGSGLTNLAFCQPGTQIIELFSPNYVYHCYWWISNLLNLDYYYLIGQTLPGWHLQHLIYPQIFSEDILISLQDISQILQIAGIT